MSTKLLARQRPGRPKKFGRASRPITVTLPEDVLSRLTMIDADVGRAIVAAVEGAVPPRARAVRPAELATYGNHAVIIVTPVKVLQRLAGVELIPIGNGRALISLRGTQAIPRLELEILDAIAREGPESRQRPVLEAIADILRDARLSPGLTVEERTIIVLESRRRRRA